MEYTIDLNDDFETVEQDITKFSEPFVSELDNVLQNMTYLDAIILMNLMSDLMFTFYRSRYDVDYKLPFMYY